MTVFDPTDLIVAASGPADTVAVAIGAHPDPEFVGRASRLLVKRHAHGTRTLERALREALFLGWGARDALRHAAAGSGDGGAASLPAPDLPIGDTHHA